MINTKQIPNPLDINPKLESNRIIQFLKMTFKKQKIQKAVIGLSEGIDSTTSLFLLKEAIGPQNIIAIHMPYFKTDPKQFYMITTLAKIPEKNIHILSIKSMIDTFKKTLEIPDDDLVRLGNIMARVRMILLFDFAKKNKAMVCGTENKSEHFLAYYTRYGDEASDIEPIRGFYKTQVKQLAAYLGIPDEIINQPPTAGLWQGQTDEKQFGFSYEEADIVLNYFFEKNLTIQDIEKQGFTNAGKIIDWVKQNEFKHEVPYTL